ncbi:restriction endonuclease [Streptomyces sp. NPDC048669]|uniref:restriction endonuclease n=1 Tax=Streptomyces sp. NPDC048669 TaxID=3155267 RepID=UPI0034181135
MWAHRYQQQWARERARQQALRYALPQLDALHHRDFEYAVRLMRRDGCTDARQIGGAGDNGADVLATDPMGRTWVIQCKHRKDGDRGSAVGTPDLQRVNGCARQLYGADVVDDQVGEHLGPLGFGPAAQRPGDRGQQLFNMRGRHVGTAHQHGLHELGRIGGRVLCHARTTNRSIPGQRNPW